jgi:hypothetical protein
MRLFTIAIGGVLALAFGTCVVGAEDILPLRRGYYVNAGVPCLQASNATLSLFQGDVMGSAHVKCRTVSSTKQPDGSYRVVDTCQDQQSAHSKPETNVSTFRIVSETEYEIEGGTARYCSQSELPSPWCCVDLTEIGVNRE